MYTKLFTTQIKYFILYAGMVYTICGQVDKKVLLGNNKKEKNQLRTF